MDEIDEALFKCVEDKKSFRNLKIVKI